MKIVIDMKEMKELKKKLADLGEKKVPGACMRALNRAASRTQTEIRRKAGAKLGVTQKRLKNRVRFQRRDQASKDKLRSQVFIVISNLPVIYLGKAKQLAEGVLVKGRFYERAFVATVGKHKGVFRRITLGPGIMSQQQWRAIFLRRGMEVQGATTGYLRFKEVKEKVGAQLMGISDDMIEKVGEPEFRQRFRHELERAFK